MYGSRLLIFFHDITAGFADNLLDFFITALDQNIELDRTNQLFLVIFAKYYKKLILSVSPLIEHHS